jgi:broad specificity phosphatase PhoE
LEQSTQLVELESSLVEQSQGDWEDKLKEHIYSRTDVKEGFDKDSWNYVPGDEIKGESHATVARRMNGWLERMVEEHSQGKIAAFTHGLAIKYLLTDIFDFDKTTAYKIPIDNTSISIIKYKDGRLICTKRNDTSHLNIAGLSTVKGTFDDSKMDTV